MLEFGFPDHIASTPAAIAIMHINNARTTVFEPPAGADADEPEPFRPLWRVWTAFVALCLLSLIAFIDSTVITTSLPTVTRELGGAGQYVWIANSYLFSCTVPQPLYGQIANIFGRRNPIFFAIALFALGSGLAGGAQSIGMLITGRTIQGLGSGGLYVLSDIIICDIIPPRYRGPYISAVLSIAAIGITIGPVIGGALVQLNWRWVFWINLPVIAAGFLAIVFALSAQQYKRSPIWLYALTRVDFIGNVIFVPLMTAIFFGLIMGGQDGMPTRLFKHRTSATGFILIFLASIIIQALGYFLPVYFQAVRGVSPLMSGVFFLPFALAIVPLSGMAGFFIGFALSAIAAGLFSTLRADSSRAAWAGYQVIAFGGTGLIFTATLPSILAALPESDVAVATAIYSFVRSLGLVWGAIMAAITFNDPTVRGALHDGGAYAHVNDIARLPERTQNQAIEVYEQALHSTWLVFVGVVCIGFLITFAEKHVELRKDHATDFALAKPRLEEDAVEKRCEGLPPGGKPA
ncbi:major facilitator superfamily domain-containing protein [Xylariaceae sp. FL0804]|nr:major facilitator superfamily domain-containing protein [Xylariaceae sp. FL0804]